MLMCRLVAYSCSIANRRRQLDLACRLALTGLALGFLSPISSTAAEIGTPLVSGLPWRSGASAEASFGTWRGRPLDVRVVFVNHDTWERMYTQLRGSFFKSNCTQTPLCVVSLAMFPKNMPGQHKQCEGGMFDDNHRTLAQLISAVRSNAIIRLGWEANSSGGHPWRIGSASNIPAYINCFRRLAQIHRGAGLRIEWSVAKGGTVDAYSTYPGNDVVDFWGLHYYDSGKPKQEANMWLAKAKSHGKKLDFPEWGVWKNGDNAAYIHSMFSFFQANAADIGYENYYNNNTRHQLYPSKKFPKASSAYNSLW